MALPPVTIRTVDRVDEFPGIEPAEKIIGITGDEKKFVVATEYHLMVYEESVGYFKIVPFKYAATP